MTFYDSVFGRNGANRSPEPETFNPDEEGRYPGQGDAFEGDPPSSDVPPDDEPNYDGPDHEPTDIGSAEVNYDAGDAPPEGELRERDDDGHRIGRAYLARHRDDGGRLLLRSWQGEYLRYRDAAYRPVMGADIAAELTEVARAALVAAYRRKVAAQEAAATKGGDEKPKVLVVQPVTRAIVSNTEQSVAAMAHLPSDIQPPAWINGEMGHPPDDLLVTPSATVYLPGYVAGRADAVTLPSTSLFTLSAIETPFLPDARPPRELLRFLRTVWQNDPDSIATFQEWVGYCLTADTSLQKILLLIGPPRSGKGTLARVLTALLGVANVAAPTLASLGQNFGLWPLIGKLLAVIGDARLSGRPDVIATITERLLSISGEDALTIDRKHREPMTVRLRSRVMVITNELPQLADASGALANRFVVLRLTESFLGREDASWTRRLLGELPGILLWAIEGWHRLRQRGHFVQPASADEDVRDLADLTSPVATFLRECCVIDPTGEVETKALYEAWRTWCDASGRREPGNAQRFGRDIRSAYPAISTGRGRRNGDDRQRVFRGIRLLPVGWTA